MRIFIVLLLFIAGCSHKKKLSPKDTLFIEENRDWEVIYAQELKSAILNKDDAAFYFFWPEYLKASNEKKKKSVD